MTDEEMKEKVIKHDFEFQTLTSSLKNIVIELHQITTSMKNVAVITEQITNMDNNIKESFVRVYTRIDKNESDIEKLQEKDTSNSVDILNRAVFGKDGRGGIIFDVEDIKKFMYKSMGAFTAINMIIALISYLVK